MGSSEEQQGHRAVLVTGFQPFLAFDVNPSGEVAQVLDGRCWFVDEGDGVTEVCTTGLVMNVSGSGIQHTLDFIASSGPWHAVIHLGLEDSSKGLRLELAAANILASADSAPWSCPLDPSNGTRRRRIDEQQPWLLATTVDLRRVSLHRIQGLSQVQHLQGIKEIWSRDAGTYFCNELYFRSLSLVRPGDRQDNTLFVHLPDVARVPASEGARIVQDIIQTVLF